MPWSPSGFKKKHNHSLSLKEAGKAADIAEAMMKRGVPEGEAIATANKRAKGAAKAMRKKQ